jgi:hypothetical protein
MEGVTGTLLPMAGMTAGGTLGGTLGSWLGPVGTVMGATSGSGAGFGLGEQAQALLRENVYHPENRSVMDNRPVMGLSVPPNFQQIGQVGALEGATAEGLAQLGLLGVGAPIIKHLQRYVTPEGRALYEMMKAARPGQDILADKPAKVMASQVGFGGPVDVATTMANAALYGGGRMRNAARAVNQEFDAFARQLPGQIAPSATASDPVAAAQGVIQSNRGIVDARRAAESATYDDILQRANEAQVRVPMVESPGSQVSPMTWKQRRINQEGGVRGAAADVLNRQRGVNINPASNTVDMAHIATMREPGLTWSHVQASPGRADTIPAAQAQELQAQLGEEIRQKTNRPTTRRDLMQVKKALDDATFTAYDKADPRLSTDLQRARAHVAKTYQTYDSDEVRRLIDKDPQKLFEYLSGPGVDATEITKLREAVDAPSWESMKYTGVKSALNAAKDLKAGAVGTDYNKFIQQWQQIDPDGLRQKAFFDPQHAKDILTFAKIGQTQQRVTHGPGAMVVSFSQASSGKQIGMSIMRSAQIAAGMGGAYASEKSGHHMPAIGAAAFAILGPDALAKVLSNGYLTRLLVEGVNPGLSPLIRTRATNAFIAAAAQQGLLAPSVTNPSRAPETFDRVPQPPPAPASSIPLPPQ